jgi:hypothetical protein
VLESATLALHYNKVLNSGYAMRMGSTNHASHRHTNKQESVGNSFSE